MARRWHEIIDKIMREKEGNFIQIDWTEFENLRNGGFRNAPDALRLQDAVRQFGRPSTNGGLKVVSVPDNYCQTIITKRISEKEADGVWLVDLAKRV